MKHNHRPNYKKLMPTARRMTRPDGTRYWMVGGKEFASLREAWAHFKPATPRARIAAAASNLASAFKKD